MALHIKSPKANSLARELAALTGESLTQAVTKALKLRLEHVRREQDHLRRERLKALIDAIRERGSRIPVLDTRPDDEILGYNEYGTFD